MGNTCFGSSGLKCNAKCQVNNAHEPDFDQTDIYYSNQGQAGTCARHAVAKAMQREITGYTDNQYRFLTSALVQFLVMSLSQKGADGCYVTDLDGAKGQVIAEGGYVCQVEIGVRESDNGDYAHVAVVHLNNLDLRETWPEGHDCHALFIKERGFHSLTLRNSWGNHLDNLEVAHSKISEFYYVTIRTLIVEGFGDEADIVLCEGGKWQR